MPLRVVLPSSGQAGASTIFWRPLAANAAEITVNKQLIILQSPVNIAVFPGDPASFEVEVSGTPSFTYQWIHNEIEDTSRTTDSSIDILDITNASLSDVGTYQVRVTDNAQNEEFSLIAELSFLTLASIDSAPTNQSVWEAETTQFVVTTNGSPPIAYRWFKNSTLILGATGNILELFEVSLSDQADYSVAISNNQWDPDDTVQSTTFTLTVLELPNINSQPVGADTFPGSVHSFEVGATG
ncbi:MAG: immunoglobulin domain-containing protein, partial [Cohaesibacteraceae bacterium]|nr:immunoglobulin domain-containing protein [Cohaesibacteraceae bacterium]